jgi:UDP-N-acetylglucosamine--N-acetylmuramyl-(pentapeptide) pyrophosphoryl-undecaprenol N-acetylglucosamine transferase
VIATGYPGLLATMPRYASKAIQVGNPVRAVVREAAAIAYEAPGESGPVRLLVFGGSQGAHVMSEVVPAAIERLHAGLRARIELVQQCRLEDLLSVKTIYLRLKVKVEIKTFFEDLPARIAQSHIVIARSGAATVTEVAVIGRPALLVPLPHSLDQDQLANASALAAAGGALIIREPDFNAERLARELTRLITAPATLKAMAAAARRTGKVDAVERLADLVVRVAGLPQIEYNKPA